MWKKPNIKTTLHILRTTPICAYKIQDKYFPISALSGGSNVATEYDCFMVSNCSSSWVAWYEKEEELLGMIKLQSRTSSGYVIGVQDDRWRCILSLDLWDPRLSASSSWNCEILIDLRGPFGFGEILVGLW